MKTAKKSYHPYIPRILPCMPFLIIRVVAFRKCYKIKGIKTHSYSSEEIFPHQKRKEIVSMASVTSFARTVDAYCFMYLLQLYNTNTCIRVWIARSVYLPQGISFLPTRACSWGNMKNSSISVYWCVHE